MQNTDKSGQVGAIPEAAIVAGASELMSYDDERESALDAAMRVFCVMLDQFQDAGKIQETWLQRQQSLSR